MLLIMIAHHTFPESGHPEVTKILYYVSFNCGNKNTHLGFYVADVSRSTEGRVFLFSCERLGRDL